ncbi:MAG: hypothetical protein GY708_04215 [Actinomycetia bacterium]|nr:hypothetical protein [Actinomycetes bacterium]MCP4962329.1 hypothetical protein [Actinomycetes bacterium]
MNRQHLSRARSPHPSPSAHTAPNNRARKGRRVANLAFILTTAALAAALSTVPHTSAAFTDITDNSGNALTSDTLDPPTSTAATGGADITIDWTATPDSYATGHRVYRSTSSGGPYTQIAQITPRTTVTHTDNPADGTYYYVVRSYYLGWESADSNEDAATLIGVLYLHNNPSPPTGGTSSQGLLPLDTNAPTATSLYNYDTDRDAFAGLVIAKGSGLGETEATKIQRWMYIAAGGLDLSTAPQLTISTAMKDFSSGKNATAEAGLYDCTAAGASCTLLASDTVTSNPWPSSWQDITFTFGTLSHTISAGRALVIKLVVDGNSDDNLWFAYDTTSYQARIDF